MIKRLVVILCLLLGARVTLAQEQVTPIVPFSTPAPLVIVTPSPDDSRAASCAAYSLPDFAPHQVRAGETIAELIADNSAVTVTQLAALNCLDDPDALPVGAVIWLPRSSTADESSASTETEAIIEIVRFEASDETILNTDSVTFTWSASGDRAYFYPCATEACPRRRYGEPLPVSGSITRSGFRAAGTLTYRLDVEVTGNTVTRDVSIEIACAQEWLGGVGTSSRCPAEPPLTVYGVWQPFEHGVMLWFSDSEQIYVMTNDGLLRIYVDQFVEGQPDPPDQAPADRFTPVRGFGMIWTALGGAESPLGWALANEVGYDAARQPAGRTSYTTYIQAPGDTVYAITELPGSEIGYWAQVAG